MKKLIFALICFICGMFVGYYFVDDSYAQSFKSYAVYTDAGKITLDWFIPSGFMGDIEDLKVSARCLIKPKTGKTCIKIQYTAQKTRQQGWAGVYWQYPMNNWGDMPDYKNLTGANKLTFWAKGEQGTECIDLVKMGGIQGQYPDSADAKGHAILLTNKWHKYSIDLKGLDLSHVIGGFAFIVTESNNPDGAIFYLDEIVYE